MISQGATTSVVRVCEKTPRLVWMMGLNLEYGSSLFIVFSNSRNDMFTDVDDDCGMEQAKI